MCTINRILCKVPPKASASGKTKNDMKKNLGYIDLLYVHRPVGYFVGTWCYLFVSAENNGRFGFVYC